MRAKTGPWPWHELGGVERRPVRSKLAVAVRGGGLLLGRVRVRVVSDTVSSWAGCRCQSCQMSGEDWRG